MTALRDRSYRFVDDSNYRHDHDEAEAVGLFGFSRGAALAVGAGAALLGCAVVASASYLLFRDDMLAGLLERQTQMQYAYEDRLAAARLRLDQATSRQMLDQDSVEGKVQKLVMREAMLETRAAVVAQLVERAAQGGALEGASMAPRAAPAPPPMAKNAAGAPRQASVGEPIGALAPLQPLAPAKPQPEGLDLRLPTPAEPAKSGGKAPDHAAFDASALGRSTAALANAADSGLPMPMRLANLALSLDHMEQDQSVRLSGVVKPALAAAGRLRRAFDLAGLPVDRYVTHAHVAKAAMGGPFIPVDAKSENARLFERDLAAAQYAVGMLDGLRRALPSVPLRKPLAGELQMTSTFGYRTDPFFGRPALHSGVDLREEIGTPVHVTAAGRVVSAGTAGGYGNMVEVDHGGGFSTRYGHLSAILVSPGQQLPPGAVIGRVGSTGRSTGPHLHYEVRTEGEAIDPARFLRAAAALGAGS